MARIFRLFPSGEHGFADEAVPLRSRQPTSFSTLLSDEGWLDDPSLLESKEAQWLVGHLHLQFSRLHEDLRKYIKIYDVEIESTNWLGFCKVLWQCNQQLAGRKNVELSGLVEVLASNAIAARTEDNEEALLQLIFFAVGQLTMLFDPAAHFTAGKLCISSSSGDRPHRRPRQHDIWQKTFIPIDEVRGSIGDILQKLSRWDNPLPTRTIPPRPTLDGLGDSARGLSISNLNYYTLSALAGIKIHWVTNVCEHMVFDSITKELKLFAYPSFSVLQCLWDETEQDACTTICFDICRQRHDSNYEDVSYGYLTSKALHTEILCSFRLIFGQSKIAYNLFRKGRNKKQYKDDPLLRDICGKPWQTVTIYEELDLPAVRAVYSVQDLPYLYQRLADLQDYVNDQCPTGWTSLWRDRRDIGRFWTLWAALIFGLATVIFSIVQISLAIVQVVAAFRQSS